MITIPSGVFETYKDFADAMINDLGVMCKVIYPPKKIPCTTCTADGIGNKPANRFASGGYMPTNFGSCHVCGGDGFKEQTLSDNLKFRVYSDAKSFSKVGNSVSIPEGSLLIIGFIYDLPKVQQANKIQINIEQDGYGTWIYEKEAEILPWGLKKDRYFSAFLTRSG